ncbi:cyclin-dependent kinase 4 inhibitor C-like [Camellia sinensis]|uniref:Uncharacterized protein n=1 Tax=Camellia sinensis var. sinensis TaxID=542762 RepID=A0A4S4E6U6_CAMSN|nr:cyclin-dependent kinase 4 inhibitor C-like [Camellia sinensis]THG11759.1 hypothetical protein TEA_005529 [Camellia sinensis var. sinensis]
MAEKEEIIKKNLIKRVMKGEWKKVVEICGRQPEVRRMKINKSGGTALHMAVYEGQEQVVKDLLDMIEDSDADDDERELALADKKGNTALHLAAKMGNERMCVQIAWKMPGLIGFRNKDSETPLFLAALYGKKHAFMSLSIICC